VVERLDPPSLTTPARLATEHAPWSRRVMSKIAEEWAADDLAAVASRLGAIKLPWAGRRA
jgi:hypothetical protein